MLVLGACGLANTFFSKYELQQKVRRQQIMLDTIIIYCIVWHTLACSGQEGQDRDRLMRLQKDSDFDARAMNNQTIGWASLMATIGFVALYGAQERH